MFQKIIVTIITLFFSMSTFADPPLKTFNTHNLKGQDARLFELPSDIRLIKQNSLSNKKFKAIHYQQMLTDIPIFGAKLTIISDENNQQIAVIGRHYSKFITTNRIHLNNTAAIQAVKQKIGSKGKWRSTLYINPINGRHFYIVENKKETSRWFHWVDSESGIILNAYDGLTTGSGIGVLGDQKDLTGLTTLNGNRYELISSNQRIVTYDAKGKNRLPGILAIDNDDDWIIEGRTSPGQAALVDAHFYANITDNYFISQLDFNWLTHYQQGMVSSAHVKRNYNNAYWNGYQMAYGDGDNVTFTNLSGDLDVVGHELAHGLTEATSDLIYQNESGALNESFSDIMGTNIEFFYNDGDWQNEIITTTNHGNWSIGEDITINGNGIRNMANPSLHGDPTHYADRYTGSGDNGGVHINSGIINHWYYLLVNGGVNAAYSSVSKVEGIGLHQASQIVYDAFASLAPNASFCDARDATLAVSDNTILASSNVAAAWDEVGIDDVLCNGTGDGGDTGTGENDDLSISNITSSKLKGRNFQIEWNTNIASTSEVIFNCCGSFTNDHQTTAHSLSFTGTKNTSYIYYVSSKVLDNNGATLNQITEGPYTHNNS